MAEQIEASSQNLIQLLGTERGKIAAEAAMEVYAAPAFLRYWSGKTFAAGRSGEARPGSLSITLREAIGVAGISPVQCPCGPCYPGFCSCAGCWDYYCRKITGHDGSNK